MSEVKLKKQIYERSVQRNNNRKEFLSKKGVGSRVDKASEWRKLLLSTLEYEGTYVRPVGKPIPKNETMRLLEQMANDNDYKERIQAALGAGQMRVHFPEMQSWADEILMVLGTDNDQSVRRTAFLALNMTVTTAQHYLKILKKEEEKESA